MLISSWNCRFIPWKRDIFDRNWHILNEWFNNFGIRPTMPASFSALLVVRSQFLTFWNQKLSFLTFFELHFYGRQWIKFLVGWLVDYSRFLRVLINAKPIFWFMKIHKNSNKTIKHEQSWIKHRYQNVKKIKTRNFRKNNQ